MFNSHSFCDLSVALCPEIPLTAFLLSSRPLLSLKSLKIRQNINKVIVIASYNGHVLILYR